MKKNWTIIGVAAVLIVIGALFAQRDDGSAIERAAQTLAAEEEQQDNPQRSAPPPRVELVEPDLASAEPQLEDMPDEIDAELPPEDEEAFAPEDDVQRFIPPEQRVEM